jgi:hypothetical protein
MTLIISAGYIQGDYVVALKEHEIVSVDVGSLDMSAEPCFAGTNISQVIA